MTNLLNVTIAAAQTITPGSVYQLRQSQQRSNMVVQFNFTYGSGGTSADAYLQTSLDGGSTWVDVANFHATTASLRKIVNLSSSTPVTTQNTPTDGTLTANTAVDGIIGPKWRVKWVSVGTYAGGTTLAVDAFSTSGGLLPQ